MGSSENLLKGCLEHYYWSINYPVNMICWWQMLLCNWVIPHKQVHIKSQLHHPMFFNQNLCKKLEKPASNRHTSYNLSDTFKVRAHNPRYHTTKNLEGWGWHKLGSIGEWTGQVTIMYITYDEPAGLWSSVSYSNLCNAALRDWHQKSARQMMVMSDSAAPDRPGQWAVHLHLNKTVSHVQLMSMCSLWFHCRLN